MLTHNTDVAPLDYEDAALTIAGEMNVVMPERYQKALGILKEMNRIDECKDVADRMEALAIYWKQTNDEEMENLARRLRVRAYRRVGELLKEFDARGGDHGNQHESAKSTLEDTFAKTQSEIAEEAGLSKKQQVTAVRLATIPEDIFEEQIEADKVPTITKLADQAIRKRQKEMNRPSNPEDGLSKKYLEDIARPHNAQINRINFGLREFADLIDGLNADTIHDEANDDEIKEIFDSFQEISEWVVRLVGVK